MEPAGEKDAVVAVMVAEKNSMLYCGDKGIAEMLTVSNSEEFEIVRQKELSLIAFGTPWSSPCQVQHMILVSFTMKHKELIANSLVDVEKYPMIARKCNIQTVPTLIIYRKRREIRRLVGLQSVETLNTLIQDARLSGVKKCTADDTISRLESLPTE